MFVCHADLAVGKALPHTPCNVFGNAAAFFLCKARHDRQEQLALAVEGVNALLFEVAFHAMLFELANGGQAVHGVSGEAADGLGYNQINLSGQRIRDHLIEAIPVAGVQAADAFVRIYFDKLPFGMLLDVIGVLAILETSV